jgi:hypothetical protein
VRRAVQVLPLLAALLAGCPIPQPLPDYPAGTITPPRIVVDDLLGDGAVTLVPAGCPSNASPSYPLSASIVDTNTIESVAVRWFVNYDFRAAPWCQIQHDSVILPNGDITNLTRAVPGWTFEPYVHPPPYGTPPLSGPPYSDAGVVRIVELVASNGFDPGLLDTTAPGANRAPKPGFETQYHRWVFLTVPQSPIVQCPTPSP